MSIEGGSNNGREFISRRRAKELGQYPENKPSIQEFHEKAKAAGAYDKPDQFGRKITEEQKALMESYFTTRASYEDLRPMAGGVRWEGVQHRIHVGFGKLWKRLPPEIRNEYTTKITGPDGQVHMFEPDIQDFETPSKHKGKRHKKRAL